MFMMHYSPLHNAPPRRFPIRYCGAGWARHTQCRGSQFHEIRADETPLTGSGAMDGCAALQRAPCILEGGYRDRATRQRR
jgi:hypothetical protein